MPGQVDIDHRLPILREHVVEHLVPEDAGGVEDDMDAAEDIARLLHHLEAIVEITDRAEIGDRFAARGLDLVSHRLCRGLAAALAGAADAGIDDDDLRALFGHQLGDFRADPARRTGADRHAPIEHAHLQRSSRNTAPEIDRGQLTRRASALSIRPACRFQDEPSHLKQIVRHQRA